MKPLSGDGSIPEIQRTGYYIYLDARPLPIFSFTIYQFAHKKKTVVGSRSYKVEVENKFAVLIRQRLKQPGLIRIVTNQIQVKPLFMPYGHPN